MTTLGLYKLFVRHDKREWFQIVAAALLAGLMQGLSVLLINEAASTIAHGRLNFQLLLLFLTALGAYSLASHFSTSRTIGLTERIIFARYVSIADKVRNARALEYEQIGKQKIYSTLEVNADIILETSKNLASVGAALAMIVFCALYILTLSPLALAVIIVFYVFGIFVYTENMKRSQTLLRDTVKAEGAFKGLFRHFIEGFKELRVNSKKADDIYDNHVTPASNKAESLRISAERSLTVNVVFSQSYYYTIVAAVIFLLPQISGLSTLLIVKIAAVVLFTHGSVTRIVNAIPLLLKSEKAIARLDELDGELTAAQDPGAPFSNRFRALPDSEAAIRLQDVRFTYPDAFNSSQFILGPVSLTFRPGEILFIVGGNGSGKTTLLKILAGLYAPQEGTLLLGSTPINADSYADYRNRISVIFPDYYLFDRFYGMENVDEARLQETLKIMELENHVHWRDGAFNEFRLSAGQSKRMAILCSHMEGKPVLLIDEVAADLDPAFRKFFYEEYLRSLQESGVSIIAVSHDEKYFHLADHLIKMENGRIVTEEKA